MICSATAGIMFVIIGIAATSRATNHYDSASSCFVPLLCRPNGATPHQSTRAPRHRRDLERLSHCRSADNWDEIAKLHRDRGIGMMRGQRMRTLLRFHSLRHPFVSELANADIPVRMCAVRLAATVTRRFTNGTRISIFNLKSARSQSCGPLIGNRSRN
jgi:hypothetical protein